MHIVTGGSDGSVDDVGSAQATGNSSLAQASARPSLAARSKLKLD
jgi:hypothetical protein